MTTTETTVTPDTLTRIFNLANNNVSTLYAPTASILRKMASADSSVSKAAFIVQALNKEESQASIDAILRAVESLQP